MANYPQTTSLNGNEIVPAVQVGTTVKIPVSQIASYTLGLIGGVNIGVLSFNARAGVVTLLAADVTGVGGALTASPAFTGTPTAPTASPGTNTTQLATTAFVTASEAGLAPLASPALTGTPTAPTASPGTNTTQIASTAFTAAAVSGLAPLASPAFTGTPTVPTATLGTNNTQAASTAFVIANGGGAPINSPAFTGVPTVPTAALNTNTTQIADTAFVIGQASTTTPLVDGTATIGTATTWARADHIHPHDTGFLLLTGGTLSGALTVAQTAGIVGTTTNNSAAAGSFGEYVTATQATPQSMTTATITNITSISLTAGDWDVDGNANIIFTTGGSIVSCGISTTTGAYSGIIGSQSQSSSPAGLSQTQTLPTGTARLLLSGTTTVFLVAESTFAGGTCTGTGFIRARRAR